MNDSILDKYTGKPANGDGGHQTDGETADDLGSFGWLRGVRDRAVMLELRHRDGSCSAFAYAWLKKATFDPSGEITLDFSGETVRLFGRNLNSESRPQVRLLQGILRHRVPWIQEADEPTALEAPKEATVVERFEVKA